MVNRKLSDYAKGALGISRNKYERRVKKTEDFLRYGDGKAYSTTELDAAERRAEKAKKDLNRYNRKKGYSSR